MAYISKKYDLVWQLSIANNYQFTSKGVCVNVATNRVIKKTVVGYTVGYNIKGRFRSLKWLKFQLVRINKLEQLPF